jgi:DNA polymerase-3 subunit beta
MKLKVQREAFLTACQIVGAAVAPRTTMPVLACIKAEAFEDALVLMGTDTEISIRYELRGVEIKKPGQVILPPGKLIAILRESSDEEISLDGDESKTILKTSSGVFELSGQDPSAFPPVEPLDTAGSYHEVRAGLLKTLIRRTGFAADKKEGTRWAVTGVLWEAEKDKCRLVATDTKRLALAEAAATIHGNGATDGKITHLIPGKAITLLERNLADDGDIIQIALQPNGAQFQTGRWLIHTKLVQGKFPPYKDIIPKKATVKIPIEPAAFASRLRQSAIMTDDETKRVDFHFESGKVTMKARGAETGSSEVHLDLEEHTGGEVDIAFDPNYILDMLRAIEGEPKVHLEMSDGSKPAVFKLDENYTYLVMPMGN